MEFLATYWWLWLILLIASVGFASHNQLRRMKRMQNFEQDKFFDGAWKLVVAGVIVIASAVMLAIALIINVATYLQ